MPTSGCGASPSMSAPRSTSWCSKGWRTCWRSGRRADPRQRRREGERMGVSIRQKKPDGPWWVFIAHQGKRKSKCVGDYDTARKIAKECRQAIAAGDLGLLHEPEPPAAAITFGEYATRFLKATETELKPSTWREYDRI